MRGAWVKHRMPGTGCGVRGAGCGVSVGRFVRVSDLSGWNVCMLLVCLCIWPPNPPDHRVCARMVHLHAHPLGRPGAWARSLATRPPAHPFVCPQHVFTESVKALLQSEPAVTRACTPVPRPTCLRAAPARIASVTACRSTRVPTRSLAHLAYASRAKKKQRKHPGK